MDIAFEQGAFEDFTRWESEDKKRYKRLVNLIKETSRNPYTGLGYKIIGRAASMMSIA